MQKLNYFLKILRNLIGFFSIFIILSFVPGKNDNNRKAKEFSLSETEPVPIASYEYEPLGNFDSITIPLKRVGRLFLIEVKIDNIIGNLIFDTGATGLVLNKTYFRDYVINEGGCSNGITGELGNVFWTTVGRLEIGDLYYKNLKADVTDLSHIENRRGIKVLGLFGFSMIKDFEIIIDASNNELQLHRIKKDGNRISVKSNKMRFEIIQKMEASQNMMFLKGKIGGKSLVFCLDTGAEINAISNDSPKNVLNTIMINRRSTLRGAGAATTEVLYGIMNDFTIGEQSINNMETIITNLDALSEAYGVHIDGMLGFNFFEKGKICINLKKKQFGICLLKGGKS